MNTLKFWDEEMRNFPHGSEGVALWVVRKGGRETEAPLKTLFAWACGDARCEGRAARPPLGAFLRAGQTGREELIPTPDGADLWGEPLLEDGLVMDTKDKQDEVEVDGLKARHWPRPRTARSRNLRNHNALPVVA